MPLLRTGLRAVAWAVAGLLALVPLTSPGGPLAFVDVAASAPALTISGSIDGLVPGAPAVLRLTVTNPGDTLTVVRTLSARVAGASAGCSPAALSITTWHGRLEVPARGAAGVPLRLRLAPGQGGCAGATWQLVYTST